MYLRYPVSRYILNLLVEKCHCVVAKFYQYWTLRVRFGFEVENCTKQKESKRFLSQYPRPQYYTSDLNFKNLVLSIVHNMREGWRFFCFVCDLFSAVKRPKQKLYAVKRRKQKPECTGCMFQNNFFKPYQKPYQK